MLSLAKTLARHHHNDPIFLTFSRGEVVQILSKSAGNRPDLWGGQVTNSMENLNEKKYMISCLKIVTAYMYV